MSARVSDLQYVGLAVPDLAAEREFFADTWGLVEVGEQDGKVYFAAEGSPHPYVIRLRQDSEKKTDLIGFSASSRADVDALFEQVKAAGAKIISDPAPAEGPAGRYAFRFFDPDGRAIEVICDSTGAQHRTLAKGEAIPIGLSHVVLHSPEPQGPRGVLPEGARFPAVRLDRRVHGLPALQSGAPSAGDPAGAAGAQPCRVRRLVGRRDDARPRPDAREGRQAALGPRAPHRGQQHLQLFRDAQRQRGGIHVGPRRGGRGHLGSPQTYEPTPAITDQWGTGRIITGNVPACRNDPDKGLWQVPA